MIGSGVYRSFRGPLRYPVSRNISSVERRIHEISCDSASEQIVVFEIAGTSKASVVSIFLFSLILSAIFPSKVEPYFVSVSLLGIL